MAGMNVGGRARAKTDWNWSSLNTQARLELQLSRSASVAALRSCVWPPHEQSDQSKILKC